MEAIMSFMHALFATVVTKKHEVDPDNLFANGFYADYLTPPNSYQEKTA